MIAFLTPLGIFIDPAIAHVADRQHGAFSRLVHEGDKRVSMFNAPTTTNH